MEQDKTFCVQVEIEEEEALIALNITGVYHSNRNQQNGWNWGIVVDGITREWRNTKKKALRALPKIRREYEEPTDE